MQQAAASLNETRQGLGTAGAFCAFLRLRQGASSRATWILEESKSGSMISVGADDACDWQLRAAFVPQRAFSLLVVGGRTFVRSGPEPGVLLNGKPIDDGWVQVPHGGRIDVGLARIEVTMGYADTSGQLVESLEKIAESSRRTAREAEARVKPDKQVGRTTMNLGAMPIGPMVQEEEEPQLLTRPAPKRRNATIELTMNDLFFESEGGRGPRIVDTQLDGALDERASDERVNEVPLQQARLLGHESGEFEVGARRQHDDPYAAPALLEVEEPTDNRRWWLYAVAGAATLGAYGGWLVLLDHL
jgi:hypothetical protein